MQNLCDRLMLAASYVRNGSRIADIGTDHAYLPVYLVSNKIAVRALACDLRRGPLSNAEKSVNKAGLNDKIELRLSDGLKNVRPSECDDIIICGMGGTLMSDILSDAEWIKDSRYRLILQPQSHYEEVRAFLINNGFEIKQESACIDSGKAYMAMYAEYTGKIKNYPEDYCWFGLLPELKNEASLKLINSQMNLIKIKCKSEADYGSPEKSAEYKRITELAEKRINGEI